MYINCPTNNFDSNKMILFWSTDQLTDPVTQHIISNKYFFFSGKPHEDK